MRKMQLRSRLRRWGSQKASNLNLSKGAQGGGRRVNKKLRRRSSSLSFLSFLGNIVPDKRLRASWKEIPAYAGDNIMH
jgi:hypothetical protein